MENKLKKTAWQIMNQWHCNKPSEHQEKEMGTFFMLDPIFG